MPCSIFSLLSWCIPAGSNKVNLSIWYVPLKRNMAYNEPALTSNLKKKMHISIIYNKRIFIEQPELLGLTTFFETSALFAQALIVTGFRRSISGKRCTDSFCHDL